MTTYYQQVTAAYVKARQAEELQAWPKPIDPHASYEPHCLERWGHSVAAMDEMVALLGKPASQPSKEHA